MLSLHWEPRAGIFPLPMPASATVVRPAQAADLPALARLIARVNATPSTCCLHCSAARPAEIRATLRDPESFPGGWERCFVVGTADLGHEVTTAFGCQFSPDATLGYLWGPWISTVPEDWSQIAPTMLEILLKLLPASTRRIDAFLHAENRSGLRFLQSHGFAPGPLTHLYVATRSAWPDPDPGDQLYPPLRLAHEVGFATLHRSAFPAVGSTPTEDLLAGRDDSHAIFAATDGLKFLGSVCVSVNHAPLEGFIDYLAVKPSARGQGIGARLLRTALRWIFDDRRLPQAALTVSDWRTGAQRLYEQAGFVLHVSGIAMRRTIR